jgi:lipoprotein NlpD
MVGASALLVACASDPATRTRETGLPPLPSYIPTTPAPAATTTLPAFYDVQRGDTLDAISKKLGVAVAALVAANHLPNPDAIQAGQRLIVPRPPPVPAAAPTTPAPTGPPTTLAP